MKNRLYSKIISYLKLLRAVSWIKNIFVFVPLVFSKNAFNKDLLVETILAFFAFSLASSVVYIFNDLMDLENDKLHPEKRNRPLAGEQIKIIESVVLFSVLIIAVIFFSMRFESSFTLVLWIYIALNFLYTLWLKEIVIVDIFCIAFGFMLRVFSGAFAINVYISTWLILTTIFISLFLAVMKRRVEISGSPNAADHRAVLKDYTINFIDQIASISAGGVILSYALYSVSERTVREYGSESLVFTTFFVIFGIFRYMFIVHKKSKGENVAEVLLSDLPMIINALLFTAYVIYIIYY